jgi:hypothetical protein
MANEKGSAKGLWEGAKRERFESRLMKRGWRLIKPNLWQRGDMRLELDDWGLFLFERGLGGKWVRTQGLSDDRICGYKSKGDLVGKFNNGLYLDLELCELVRG